MSSWSSPGLDVLDEVLGPAPAQHVATAPWCVMTTLPSERSREVEAGGCPRRKARRTAYGFATTLSGARTAARRNRRRATVAWSTFTA